MKLFDYLQDCVAIGAVLFLVVTMTSREDDGDAVAAAKAPHATTPRSGFDSGMSSLSTSLSAAEIQSEANALSSDLDALDRELDALLADSPSGTGLRMASPSIPSLAAPGQEPGELKDVVRNALPMPDASDYNLATDEPLLPSVMPWQQTPQQSATTSQARRRNGGDAPDASRPMTMPFGNAPRRLQPVREDLGIEEFGASLLKSIAKDIASAPPVPRRLQ